jgi:protease-4
MVKIMKKVLVLILCVLAFGSLKAQHSFLTYYEMAPMMQASPGAFKFGLYGFDNPAVTSYLHAPDIQFSWMQENKGGINPWGAFTGSPYGGFGVFRSGDSAGSVYDYRYSVATGSKKFALGFSYGFVGGDKSRFGRSNTASWGALFRPVQYFSLGLMQNFSLKKNDFESIIDFAIRPLGDAYPLAFFVDASMFNKENLKDAKWSGGLSWEIVEGVRFNGRYFSTKGYSAGVDISYGQSGIAGIASFDSENKNVTNAYTIRMGANDRTFFKSVAQPVIYIKMDLSGELKYQKGLFFDHGRSFYSTLKKLQLVKESKTIKGLVINFTNAAGSREMMWEIREELQKMRESGKKIIIFVDRGGLDQYHFASVADKIVIDPLGTYSFEGYMLGRSYYKKMLDKAHIGYDEIRLWKYKSAVESFARETMSEGDREQRQALVDDWYEIAKKEISASKNLKEGEFDKIVDETFLYNADKLLEMKLADTTGRWSDYQKIVDKINGKSIILDENFLMEQPEPIDDKWAYEPKKIAVIYALGECSMDAGIKARTLINDVKWAMENKNIAAVVLRVDSPGGDAMASDYIAEVLRENKGKKPIIVSQGAVAASGGYWLSMYADTIVAAPMTITGSIGVISSWVYDKGLKDTLGINVDLVKRGKFADLGYSYELPILPLGLPVNKLNDEQRGIIEKYITGAYDMFTKKVSDGRKVPVDQIREVAQGRVWSGLDGKDKKLVDVLGGLQDAIEIAKQKAGITKKDYCKVIELPKPQFNLSLDLLGMIGVDTKLLHSKENILLESLKMRVENNGKPLFILPVDYYDSVVWE